MTVTRTTYRSCALTHTARLIRSRRRRVVDERHIYEEEDQKQRCKQDGPAISKSPDKRLEYLHRGIITIGKHDRPSGQHDAEHECQDKRGNNLRILLPFQEIQLRYRAYKPRVSHISTLFLSPLNTPGPPRYSQRSELPGSPLAMQISPAAIPSD